MDGGSTETGWKGYRTTAQPDHRQPSRKSKPYAELDITERWDWHAEIYAFRIVALGHPPEDRTSPCDPDGAWYDESLVRAACARLRDKRRLRSKPGDADLAAEGRNHLDRLAREQGYPDFDAYQQAGGTYAQAIAMLAPEIKTTRTKSPREIAYG